MKSALITIALMMSFPLAHADDGGVITFFVPYETASADSTFASSSFVGEYVQLNQDGSAITVELGGFAPRSCVGTYITSGNKVTLTVKECGDTGFATDGSGKVIISHVYEYTNFYAGSVQEFTFTNSKFPMTITDQISDQISVEIRMAGQISSQVGKGYICPSAIYNMNQTMQAIYKTR